MFKLTVFLAGQKVQNFDFTDKQFVTVGREKGCEVHIDNIGVSRKHCQIERKENLYVLRDLNSGNGTFVAGRRITTHNLNSGDEIMLGKYTILFERPKEEEEGTQVLGAPKEKKGVDAVGATLQMDADQVAAMQRQRATRVRAHLLMVMPDGSKSTTHLDRSLYVIGKAPSCHIQAAGWKVSPKHAIIFRDETGFRLINVSSKGPTLVNNRPVEDQRLKDGDVIQIAKSKYQFMSPQGAKR